MIFQNICPNFKLIKKLNVFFKLPVRIAFLGFLTVICLLLPTSIANAETSNDPGYPVCYFGKFRWEWGLHTQNADDWQALSGNWRREGDTWKFYSSTSKSEVEQSCQNAKVVRNKPGDVTSIYVASSKHGLNYGIVYN